MMNKWKWMPMEPTEEMVMAGLNHGGWACGAAYSDMFAVAPEPPADPKDIEIKRLQALVEEAFLEGWWNGAHTPNASDEEMHKDWRVSDSFEALRGESGDE